MTENSWEWPKLPKTVRTAKLTKNGLAMSKIAKNDK